MPELAEPILSLVHEVDTVLMSMGVVAIQTAHGQFDPDVEFAKDKILVVFGCQPELVTRDVEMVPMEWSWANKIKPFYQGSDDRRPNPYVTRDQLDDGIFEAWVRYRDAIFKHLMPRNRAVWAAGIAWPPLRDCWLGHCRVYENGEWHEPISRIQPTKRHIEVKENELRWAGNGGRCPTGMAARTVDANNDAGVEISVQLRSGVLQLRVKDGVWSHQGDKLNPSCLPPHVHKAVEM